LNFVKICGKVLIFINKKLEEIIGIFLLFSIIIIMSIQIFFRYVLSNPLSSPNELARYLFVMYVYICVSYAIKKESHIRITFILKKLPKILSEIILYAGDIIWVIFSIIMTMQGIKFVKYMLERNYINPIFRIPLGILYMIIPIGFGLMVIRIVQNIYKHLKSDKLYYDTLDLDN